MTLALLIHQFQHWVLPEDRLLIISGASEEDYWTLASEDLKVEYSRGRLFIHSPASQDHELLFSFLLRLLKGQLEKFHLPGEFFGSRFACLLPKGHRPEPDLFFITKDQFGQLKENFFEGVPKLVIEILSPTNLEHDLTVKKEWYLKAKVGELWFIHPIEKWIERLFLNENDEYESHRIETGQLVLRVLPQLQLTVDWLWQRPLPNVQRLLAKL